MHCMTTEHTDYNNIFLTPKRQVGSSNLFWDAMYPTSFVKRTKEVGYNDIRPLRERILYHAFGASISCGAAVYRIAPAIYH